MRKQKVLETAQELVKNGEKPSVIRISQELDFDPNSVHRCLNALEKEKKVETYSKEVFGNRMRMVGVKR
ncbi:MAG: Mn-dependent DtxR family transcriptional regulator [Candidatus Nanohaloarchaea archaeon]|jgi:Mn-dependent DtxR family transcriptional regulator